jgi:hypothetical protein
MNGRQAERLRRVRCARAALHGQSPPSIRNSSVRARAPSEGNGRKAAQDGARNTQRLGRKSLLGRVFDTNAVRRCGHLVRSVLTKRIELGGITAQSLAPERVRILRANAERCRRGGQFKRRVWVQNCERGSATATPPISATVTGFDRPMTVDDRHLTAKGGRKGVSTAAEFHCRRKPNRRSMRTGSSARNWRPRRPTRPGRTPGLGIGDGIGKRK